MPRIEEFTAQNTTLRPTETGVEALAMAGRRAGAFFDQASVSITRSAQDQARAAFAEASAKGDRAKAFADVGKSFAELGGQAEVAYAHHEISQGAAAFAQLHSDLTDTWNNTASTADPNDTSIVGQFHDRILEPKLEQFRQAFSTAQGQQWAENHIESLRNHMMEKTSADMSTLAGDAVAVNTSKTTNAMTNTARNDPSAVPFLVDSVESSINGIVSSSPNLKGADAARARTTLTLKAKEDIVRAGALGVAEKTGGDEAAMAKYVSRYSDYIKPGEADQLTKAAKSFRMAASTDGERARRLAKEQADDKSEVQRDKYIQDIFSDSSQTTMKQVLSDQSLVPKDREHLIGILQKEGKTQQSDPQVRQSLVGGAFNADKPTTLDDVLRAHAQGKLNDQDFTKTYQFVKLSQDAAVDNPTYKETIKSTEKMFGNGPIGSERHAQFMQDFLPQYLKAKREGTAAGALDTRDPNSLISKVMADHMPTDAEKLRDRFMKNLPLGPGEEITGVSVQNAPVKVTTPADAAKLKPGTRYVRPDGTVMVR